MSTNLQDRSIQGRGNCRDDLIMLMPAVTLPLGNNRRTEGHMARDKRADISVAMPGRKDPVVN